MSKRMTISEFLKLTPYVTNHFKETMQSKGFSGLEVVELLKDPEEFYPSKSHPGQYRVTGRGLCVVGRPEEDKFVLITIYLDKVLTPPRADQLLSEEGRTYAERFQQGLGRGKD